jgi:heat-inducible transcriptional repressor
VVSAGYGTSGIALGGVGVLGPRRMDYAHTMARVAAVANYMGELLAEN